jgi:hypothetical protein
MLGAEPHQLVEEGFPDVGPRPITGHCPNSPDVGDGLWELGVQLTRSSRGTGTAQSILVTYSSDGREHTLTIPFQVALCTPDDQTTPDCSAMS